MEAALVQVGDLGIAQLLDSALLGLVRATSEGHLSAKDRVSLILDIRGRVDLLRNAQSRNILSALRAEQAANLCIALGIGEVNHPWER